MKAKKTKDSQIQGWRTDTPANDELTVQFERKNYKILGGTFLVWDGVRVYTSQFTRPPKKDGTWYPGYWDADHYDFTVVTKVVKAWMKLPDPPEGIA